MEKSSRKSNIELLRIITMFGVIILHYNNPLIGGALTNAGGINLLFLYFTESMFACSVDLFILISGYFLSQNNKRVLIKPLELIIQVVAFKEAVYLIKSLIKGTNITPHGIIACLIPANWFAILYISLYLISPLINILIEYLESKRSLKRIIVILLILFSLYPTAVDVLSEILGRNIVGLSSIGMYGSQWGYSIVNFSLLYIIGAYIRNEVKTVNVRRQILQLVSTVVLIVVWAYINDYTGYNTERSAWEYCNPLVIFTAVQFFLVFKNLQFQNSFINEAAKASFTVFLLHNYFLPHIKIQYFVQSPFILMLLHIVVTVTVLYLICWGTYEIYEKLTRPIFRILRDKIPMLSDNIYKGIL